MTPIENMFETNEETRRDNILKSIENHDYIKNTLDLSSLRKIKLTYAIIEELQRSIENKAIMSVMKILINLGVKKLII